MAISRDMWDRFSRARRSIYERHGKPLFPVDGMPEYVIPHATYIHEDERELKRIQAGFTAIDRDFRLIYDPLTALPGQPAYHLYTVVPNSYPGGYGKLELEFSIQRERGKEWPEGVPCKPDWSHVQRAKQSYKGARSGDIRRANLDHAAHIAEVNERMERASRMKDADLEDYMWREIWEPYLVRGKVMPKNWRQMERGVTPNRTIVTATSLPGASGHWRRGHKGQWK